MSTTMDTMPNEILLEIFRYLIPMDLIHLARTHRRFRCVLMDRHSSDVWSLARANVEDIVNRFPACPPNMSEPQYADLMFGVTCYDCGKDVNLTKCSPLGKERLCKACWPAKYKNMANEHTSYDYFDGMAIPRIRVSERKKIAHKQIFSEYSKMRESMKSKGNYTQVRSWQDKKEEEDRPLVKFQSDCFEWLERWELHLLKTGKDLVIQRIATLGWQEERDTYKEKEQIPELLESVVDLCRRPLAGKMWARLDKVLLAELNAHKTARLERERGERELIAVKHLRELRKEITSTLPHPLEFITTADLFNVPAVHQALDQYAAAPGGTLECFDFIRQEFLNYHNEWITNQEKRLIDLVRMSFYAPQPSYISDYTRNLVRETVDPTDGLDSDDPEQRRRFFSMAATLFQCGFCGFDIRYPTILGHECMTAGVHVDGSELDPNWRHYARLWECPWGSRCEPKFSVIHYARARRTLGVFGYDPDTTTYEQMAVSKRIVSCEACSRLFGEGPTYMHVQTALLHTNCRTETHVRRDPNLVFKLLPESNLTAYLRDKIRDKTIKDLLSPHTRHVACIACGERGGIQDMKQHVFTKHGQIPSKENLELWASSSQFDFTPSSVEGAHTPLGFHFHELDAETLLG